MARLNRFRRAFDPNGSFIVLRPFQISGSVIQQDEVVQNRLLPVKLLRMLFDQRYIGYAGEDAWDRTRPPHPTSDAITRKAMVAEIAGAPPIDPRFGENGIYIPENWRFGTWPQVLSLASKFAKAPITSKIEAFAAIEVEELRRAKLIAKQRAA
jgi:hypothetical protein